MTLIFNRQYQIQCLIVKLSRLDPGQFRRAAQLNAFLREAKQFILIKLHGSLRKAEEELEIAIARLNYLLKEKPSSPQTNTYNGRLPRTIRYNKIKTLLCLASTWVRVKTDMFRSMVKFRKINATTRTKPHVSRAIIASLDNAELLIRASDGVPKIAAIDFLERAEEILSLVFDLLDLNEVYSVPEILSIRQYQDYLLARIAIAAKSSQENFER